MQTTIRSKVFGEYLKSRRERIQPDKAGIKTNRRRRTPGLSREEVAYFSHISVTYYTWLEQGKDIHPSREVLLNISKALQLTPDEKEHLFNLTYTDDSALPVDKYYDASLKYAVDELPFPSFITDQRSKVIFWNEEAELKLFPFSSFEERHLLQLLFLEKSCRDRIQNADEFLAYSVAVWRNIYDRFPEDRILNQLLVTLQNQSELFRNLWDQHHIEQKKVSFISIKERDQMKQYRIHSATRVDGNEDLNWCMYIPV
ncbi:helix-turn-helix domain-containing protein [Gracilibacillus oryzae]|uniref:Helix-turn-helix domain-containing protein n=1 Tax=Gracilibacillus oryzae TaxID=1672701 RepID=A0A7C8GQN3_9BACI|nr:helix-turn-helix domain-containing protein [Gracilibacillus oryzae]KAB8126023.1 helix-turn-helix domain-containing protein [Gracilibacillus oryzae]